jgi:hypothetical protein
VKAGLRLEADLLDLTPTLLWLLDQPVPTNMDGRVLSDCFVHERPVRYVEPVPSAALNEEEAALSESDEAAIMRSLRNLGYIE